MGKFNGKGEILQHTCSRLRGEFRRLAPSGYSIVSFDVESEGSVESALNHEIAHGQFFQQSNYRMGVNDFWNSLSPDVKSAARTLIAENYDASNLELLMNEFHAYVLDGKIAGISQKSIENAKQQNFALGSALEVLVNHSATLSTDLRNSITRMGSQIWAGDL